MPPTNSMTASSTAFWLGLRWSSMISVMSRVARFDIPFSSPPFGRDMTTFYTRFMTICVVIILELERKGNKALG